MRALGLIAALTITLWAATAATAQSLTPMTRTGITPTATKGFKLLVGNPYAQKMTFRIIAMDPRFVEPVSGATARPDRVSIAPGHARTVIVAFKIDPELKERTIGFCVVPEDFHGPILPRVCGRYTGRMR